MICNIIRLTLLLVIAFFIGAYSKAVVSTLEDDDYFNIGRGFDIQGSGQNKIDGDEKYKTLNTENIDSKDNDEGDDEIDALPPLENELRTNKRPRRSSISSSSSSGPNYNETIIERQKASLMRMGCRPKRRKVYIRQALSSHDPRKDARNVTPEVVAVKRCDPSCSYCPQDAYGYEKPGEEDRHYECAPAKEVMKKFTIKVDYVNGTHEYFKETFPFHKSCECKIIQSKFV